MRALLTVLCVGLLMVTLSACRGDDDDVAGHTAAATTAVSPTPAPSATLSPAADIPTPTVAPTEEPTKAPTAAGTPQDSVDPDAQSHLEQIALAIDDFPTGWTELDMSDDDEDADETGSCGNPVFANRDRKLGEVEVGFQQSDFGPFVFQNLVEFPEEDALSAMEYVRETTTCGEWTDTDADGNEQVYRIAPLEIAAFGDDSYAVAVSVDIEGVGTLVNNSVFVRVGTTVSVIIHSEIGEPDPAQTEEYVRMAVEKMEG
jgi:hypothetical protein